MGTMIPTGPRSSGPVHPRAALKRRRLRIRMLNLRALRIHILKIPIHMVQRRRDPSLQTTHLDLPHPHHILVVAMATAPGHKGHRRMVDPDLDLGREEILLHRTAQTRDTDQEATVGLDGREATRRTSRMPTGMLYSETLKVVFSSAQISRRRMANPEVVTVPVIAMGVNREGMVLVARAVTEDMDKIVN